MAVVGMVGVSFAGPREEIERVALHLLSTENFEPMSPEVMMEGHPLGSRVRTFRGNRYDALLEKLESLWGKAGLPLPRKRAEEVRSEMSFSDLESRIDRIVDILAGGQARVEELEAERETWRAILAFGNAVRETGRNMSGLASNPYGRIAIGTLSRGNWRRLRETGLASPFLALPLIEEERRMTIVVFYGADFHEGMMKIFSSVRLRLVPVRMEEALRYDNEDAVRYHLESLEAEIVNYREMPARYISENKISLERLYALVYAKQRIYTLAQKRGELADMMILSGWIPQIAYDSVSRAATREAPHSLVMVEYGDILEEQGHELPTLLSNLPLVRRFQEIVRLYSLPAYSELDPTFVVALSFCLFFGFMFGDV
ncbi:MAG: hypothetical protein LBT65_05025, partial [Synergistaceae bacterium]|nr:hypothetical protein [Synergistaceae bacterium]